MRTFIEFVQDVNPEVAEEILAEKKWIQAAIKHPGRCTPITKPGCTGAAKALAKRFKKGGDLHK